MMKTQFWVAAIFCLAGATCAQPRELAVPRQRGLYVADLSNGRVRFLGNYSDWKLSPDRRLLVAGRETDVDAKAPLYEVDVLSTSTWAMRRLERFRIQSAGGAVFRWSGDSARVRVESSRIREEESDFKTFVIGRASTVRRSASRVLSPATKHKLKARFPHVEEVAFSPDGQRVVAYLSRGFYQDRNFDGGYWTLRPDGSGLRRLTRNTSSKRGDFQDREIVWLDGKRLAFRRTSFEDEGI